MKFGKNLTFLEPKKDFHISLSNLAKFIIFEPLLNPQFLAKPQQIWYHWKGLKVYFTEKISLKLSETI
jgi:hypothetical protein